MKRPQIGRLNRLIQLKDWQDVPEVSGGVIRQLTLIAEVYASVSPVAGSIFHASKQTGSGVTHQIIIRYRPGLNDSTVVVYAGRQYRVARVTDMNDERRFTVLEVEELGNDS